MLRSLSVVAMSTNPNTDNGSTMYLFPGQGSQVPGMRPLIQEWCPDLLPLADSLIGEPLAGRATDDTRLLQPAIYCASIAGWRCAQQRDDIVDAGAILGHSLGEIAALVAGGALSAEAGLRIVVRRGELMARAAGDVPGGGMLAALGAPDDEVTELADQLGLIIATDNAPGQLVLAGRRDLLAVAETTLVDNGYRAVLLPIEGAFHSPEMNPIKASFVAAVRDEAPGPTVVPVYSSLSGRAFTDIPDQLGESLVSPIYFRQSLLRSVERGFDTYVDCGPGHVLAKIVRRMLGLTPLAIYDLTEGVTLATGTQLTKGA